MNSENRLERSANVNCFVPLSAFAQGTNAFQPYQQVKIWRNRILAAMDLFQTCCYIRGEGSLITSGEFAGSVLREETLRSLRHDMQQPQRIKER